MPNSPPPAAEDPKRGLPVVPNSPLPAGFCPAAPNPPCPNREPVLCWPNSELCCVVVPLKRLGELAARPNGDADDCVRVKPVDGACPNRLAPVFAGWVKALPVCCCVLKRLGLVDTPKPPG